VAGPDKIPIKRPDTHSELRTVSAETLRSPGSQWHGRPAQLVRRWQLQQRAITCSTEGACAKGAARKFREGKIRHSEGTSSARLFAQPKKYERIVAKKFKRLIPHRFHESVFTDAVRRTTQTPCTADTYACAEQWYEWSLNSSCIATGPVDEVGAKRCAEAYSLNLTPRQTRDKVRAGACVRGAVLRLSRGAAWKTLAAFPGAAFIERRPALPRGPLARP